MILLPLLLTAFLDLSRPEFEPMPDASGNYIIAEIDDGSGSFVVEKVPEIPDSFTSVALAQETAADSGEVIYNRDGSGSLSGIRVTHWRLRTDQMILSYVTGYAIRYIELEVGYTYTFTTDWEFGVFVADSLSDGVSVVSIGSVFTPTQNCIAVVSGNYSLKADFVLSGNDPSGNEPDDPSGNDPDIPSGGDFDDSRLLVALGSITAQLSILELLLLFNCLFPLTRKSVHKLMNRKED